MTWQRRIHRNIISSLHFIAAMALLASLVLGCGQSKKSAGSLRVVSLSDNPVVLAGKYVTGYYSVDSDRGTSILLSDMTLDGLTSGETDQGQVLHIDLLWIPKAGATPMDSSATNATIRFVVIADGEVGVYSGAGFAIPNKSPGDDELTITLRDASLQLQDKTDKFLDLLTPAQLTGTFTAVQDPAKSRQLHLTISQFVTNKLGRRRFVLRDTPRSGS